MLPSPHLWRRRHVFASEANSVASSNVAMVKYQSVARQPRSGLRGYGKWQPIKMAVWGMYAIQICFSPELEGLLRVISLFFHWLGAKEVVLQRLKWPCHMIQWAIVRKGAQGLEHTIPWENCCRETVHWDVCIVYMNKRVGERSLVRVGRGEQGKSYMYECTLAWLWRDGKRKKKKKRMWEYGLLLLTLTFAWGIATLTFPSRF